MFKLSKKLKKLISINEERKSTIELTRHILECYRRIFVSFYLINVTMSINDTSQFSDLRILYNNFKKKIATCIENNTMFKNKKKTKETNDKYRSICIIVLLIHFWHSL